MSTETQSQNVVSVFIELAIAAETIRCQQAMIDQLKKTPEPITYLDLERQDDRDFDREG